MTENIFTPHTEPQPEPTLRRNLELPKGVLQKNLKTFVYLGAALLVIVAALFSSSGKKMPGQQASAKGQPPQPTLHHPSKREAKRVRLLSPKQSLWLVSSSNPCLEIRDFENPLIAAASPGCALLSCRRDCGWSRWHK